MYKSDQIFTFWADINYMKWGWHTKKLELNSLKAKKKWRNKMKKKKDNKSHLYENHT